MKDEVEADLEHYSQSVGLAFLTIQSFKKNPKLRIVLLTYTAFEDCAG